MEAFDKVTAMEPLMPAQQRSKLSELAADLIFHIGKVTGQVHSPIVRAKTASLVREMNCYYSNLIEGHKTVPKDIQRAREKDYSSDPVKRDNQKLSEAHIDVELLMLDRLKAGGVDVYTPDFIKWLHCEFYERLPASMRVAKTKSGKEYEIHPGRYRDFMVDVGDHTPPNHQNLASFLERFCAYYGGQNITKTDRLIAIAAAHHRLAWIHPFGDGNGRVIRLYSHAMLVHHGFDGDGLWTLSRGLARFREKYYDYLASADSLRRGALDGRGNLSDEGLSKFCVFFLETMLDQVKFMNEKLDLSGLRLRIENFFRYEMAHHGDDAIFLMKVVCALADLGEFKRAYVQELLGRKETFCRRIIALGLSEGFIHSPSPKGALQIAFPAKVLGPYFPQLFLDIEAN